MKIGSISNSYNSLNFGRALTAQEMKDARAAAKSAREAMGFPDTRGYLLLPSKSFPENMNIEDPSIIEKIKHVFRIMGDVLGINNVEISGKEMPEIDGIVRQEGLGVIKRFEYAGEGSAVSLEDAVKAAAANADGLRIVNSQSLNKAQVDAIEKAFSQAKGDKFNPRSLIFDTTGTGAFVWDPDRIADALQGKVVVNSSHYLNQNNGTLWGSTRFMTERVKAKQGEFVHGLRKSGEPSLKEQMGDRASQIRPTIKYFEDLFGLQDEDMVLDTKRWAAVKRAEVATSQDFYKHFDDITLKSKVSALDFEKIYHEALAEGKGDNYFDSLAKIMKARGLNEKNPELYETICKYRNALFAEGPKTMEEAAQLTTEQLEASYKDVKNVVLQGVNARKADIEARIKAKEIADYESSLRAKIKVFGENMMNNISGFYTKHKTGILVTGALTFLSLVGGTMYSYGKEQASKISAAKPNPQR